MKDLKNMDVDDEVRKLKSEAVHLLNSMFKIPEGYSSGTTDRIVDCIVSAATLEIASLLRKSLSRS